MSYPLGMRQSALLAADEYLIMRFNEEPFLNWVSAPEMRRHLRSLRFDELAADRAFLGLYRSGLWEYMWNESQALYEIRPPEIYRT